MHPIKISLILLMIVLGAKQGVAQHYLEVRGTDTKYRYFDWNYAFTNSILVDVFYVGVPGSNEFNLGGGYNFKPKPILTIAPLAYVVIGKEAEQRGIKVALLVAFQKNGWRANSFLGHFQRISGEVDNYQVLDTFDFSRVVHGPVEIGFSSGFFRAGGQWNSQNGPMFKLNDRLGAWYVSYRFGPDNELRFGRSFLFSTKGTD